MAQTAPGSRFKFIPTPIEQQLTAYQLGTLLEIYQLGWIRGPKGDRRFSKLIPLMIALGGLAGTVVSILGIIDVIITTHVIIFRIFIIPFITIIAAAGGIVALFQTSLCVAAFHEGFVYAKGMQVTVLRWREIASCEHTTIKTRSNGIVYVYTIRTHDGKTLKWKARYELIQNLGKIISEHIA